MKNTKKRSGADSTSRFSGSVSIKEITKQWLKANGYDGLYNCDGCGCGLADFMPCGFPNENECVAAHKRDDGFFYKGKPNERGRPRETETGEKL